MPRSNAIEPFLTNRCVQDQIIESIFLDSSLWGEVLEHGRSKGMPMSVLLYLQSPYNRAELYRQIAQGEYTIQPPHTGYRLKEDGSERVFFANEPLDRLLLYAIYKWLIRNEKALIHPACRSYQEGIGVGQTIKWLSRNIVQYSQGERAKIVGCKFDIHKYFESIDRKYIHKAFEVVEQHQGQSAIINLLKAYYDSDVYYDSRKKAIVEQYQGIKQGCAVSSWLANVILYPLDEKLNALEGCYARYSDDIIYVGPYYKEAECIIREQLQEYGLDLNEKKKEFIYADRFVRFLGYYIRGNEITLSPKWVKKFQQSVDKITIHNEKIIQRTRAIRKQPSTNQVAQLNKIVRGVAKQLMSYLYVGNGRYSWASLTLGVINRENDVKQLNLYCMDALRAVYTGKTSIGGLGVSKELGISRGKGKNVKANRIATSNMSLDYYSIVAMQKIIHNKWLYQTLVWDGLHEASLNKREYIIKEEKNEVNIHQLEELYRTYQDSQPDEMKLNRFYAKSLSDMTIEDLIRGENRTNAKNQLEDWLSKNITPNNFPAAANQWYWQSEKYPELILLRKWFDVKLKARPAKP